jgi:transcriptional regulator with GAF, ATPase, and Fis domain
VLTFNALRAERAWPDQIVRKLHLVAQIFANTLARKQIEEQLRARLEEIEGLKQKLEKENIYLREEIELKNVHEEIVGRSPAMKRVLAQVEQVAHTDATVLIEGETGTGKELLARAVHQLSPRKDLPLVTVNCAALPPTLIESELFGREKGAYTGALTRMTGRFEAAHGATLFLDEIGDLPLEVQAKLLRVLEQGRFERLGSTHTLQVNVRIIAATNIDLARQVAAGRFRKDLYFRLNVFPIHLPPLRERSEDIAPLVWTFVRQYEQKMGKRIDHIPRPCMDSLQRYPWPGNIRELRNVVERALIVCAGRTLAIGPPQRPSAEPQADLNLADAERQHITAVLKQTGGRLSGREGAAGILGLKRTTLQSKMKKLGIRRPTQDG